MSFVNTINTSKTFNNKNSFISINSNLSVDFLSKILSKNPFLLNKVDEKGETFLSYAFKRNNIEIINLLISSPLLNINYVDKNNNTYLHLAVIQQNIEAVKTLIKIGISINDKNNEGNTPLHLAYYFNFTEIIKLLLAHNADTKIKNNKGFIPEEIIPINENEKIIGVDVSENLDDNIDDQLKFDKKYKTIEISQSNHNYQIKKGNNILLKNKNPKKLNYKKNINKTTNTKIDKKKSSLFYKTEKGLRKISNIAWNFNEDDIFIRRESENYPFYIELISSGQTGLSNSPKSIETRNNTSESNSNNNNNIIINESYNDEKNKVRKSKDNTFNNNKSNILLYDFLSRINLQKYYNKLNNNGFNDFFKVIEDTKNGNYILDNQLKKLGINKPGERAKILIRLEEKANLFSFNIPKSVYYFCNDIESIENDTNLNKLFLLLKDINLDKYFSNFVNNGYFSVDLLFIQMISKNPLTDEILKNEILIDKLGYRTRLLNKLKEEYPTYLNNLKSVDIIYNQNENNRICSSCAIY